MHFFFHFFITPPTKSLRSSPQLRNSAVAELRRTAELRRLLVGPVKTSQNASKRIKKSQNASK